jgi:superoxide reductase
MVGEIEHPMIPEHFIEFIAVETNKDLKMTRLTDLDNPEANFAILPDETVEAVYAYCNLHGLWKA